MAGKGRMALLKLLPNEQRSVETIFQRLSEIDNELKDYFISWDKTKKLLEERKQLEEILHKFGYHV